MMRNCLLLFLMPNPAQLTGVKKGGCFTKENWETYKGNYPVKEYKEVDSLEACASFCSTELDWCDGFNFLPKISNGYANCFPKKGAELRAQSGIASGRSIAGWCPNSKGVSIAIQPSPLQCSSEGDICQFPVKVSGVLHWDCIDREGVKICNTQDAVSNGGDIQTFDNTDSFKPCEKCQPHCIGSDLGYSGFALHNQNSENIYKKVESESDCQQICQLAEGCNFFNFNSNDKECKLKYGVGKKASSANGNFFGPKFCPVDCKAEGSTRSPGPCNATCGVEGRRKVRLIPVVERPAEYGGEECGEDVVVEEECTGECGTTSAVVIPITVAFLALVVGIIVFLVWKRQKTSKEKDAGLITEMSSCDESRTEPGPPDSLGLQVPGLPSHSVLQKDDSLKEKVKELAAKTKLLDSEFERLGKFVKENVVKESEVAAREENKPHNRYLDIVPFDDNVIILDSELFTTISEIHYINASRIKFEDCPQEFIAAQAPKKVSFDHFWHMVIQEKVTVIVMITRLLEKKKRKADQYWPDQDQPAMELGGGGRLELVSTSYQGSYFLRKFSLSLADGRRHEVTQLHSENWPDLEAPEDPRVLVDMVHKSQELLKWKPGTLLVHCSAGVGRTGTFLALYKLWLDYQEGSCTSLALLPTVLALRRQRCLMVQKPKQYSYIVSCLSTMVSAEEGDYYEIVENV